MSVSLPLSGKKYMGKSQVNYRNLPLYVYIKQEVGRYDSMTIFNVEWIKEPIALRLNI